MDDFSLPQKWPHRGPTFAAIRLFKKINKKKIERIAIERKGNAILNRFTLFSSRHAGDAQ